MYKIALKVHVVCINNQKLNKKFFVITAALMIGALSLLHSCGRKCDGLAPKGIEISWTDYNTVSEVCHYLGYPHTNELHRDDTVWVWGYVKCTDDTGFFSSLYERAEQYNTLNFNLCSYPYPLPAGMSAGGIGEIAVHGNFEQTKWIKDYKPGQKVYAKGFCSLASPMDDRGCFYTLWMEIISANKE